MLEDVLRLRKQALLVNQFQPLETDQVGFDAFSCAGDGLQQAKAELAADDRGHLHGLLEAFLQAVHAGGNDALDGIRDLDLGRLDSEDIMAVLPLDEALIK